MKYRVLTNRFAEWNEGDIADMDWEAARVPLELGEIEPYEENSNSAPLSPKVGDTGGEQSAKVKVARAGKPRGRVRKAVGK